MSQTSQPLRLGAGMSAQAAALQARLSTLGVVAKVVGTALRLSPASKVPPDLLAEVRTHKAELLALLTAPVAAVVVAVAPRPSLGLNPADQAAVPSPAGAALGAAGQALPMAHWPPGSWRKRRYTSDLADMLWTTMARPISWADPAARPEEGSFCSNCEYATWTRDKRRADGGWCCSICHPADNVPPADRDVVRW